MRDPHIARVEVDAQTGEQLFKRLTHSEETAKDSIAYESLQSVAIEMWKLEAIGGDTSRCPHVSILEARRMKVVVR
eukprot:9497063-Pyramimonas_sp.AAC.1